MFHPTSYLWSEGSRDPRRFWQLAKEQCTILGHLAVRIFTAVTNSAPSERAFSAMKFIQDDRRCRLSIERLNQLQCIYINGRALAKERDLEPYWWDLSDEEVEAFEDALFTSMPGDLEAAEQEDVEDEDEDEEEVEEDG